MTKATLFIFGIVVVVGFGAWKGLQRPSLSPRVSSEAEVLDFASQKNLSSALEDVAAALPVKEEEAEVSNESAAQFEWFPPAQAAVAEFAELSEKIFPNPDEAMRKSEILMNADLLRNVADYLLTGNDSELKDQAIDILVEALKIGSPEATVQAERIISDSQVENSRLPASVRQSMAETKSEILSEFAALGDEKEARVPSLLPGQVSKKIWAHVQEYQEQNLRESQKELGER